MDMMVDVILYVNRTDLFKSIAIIVMVISIIGFFLPLLFIYKLPHYLIHEELDNNQSIIITYLCSISTSMPLIIDIVLDICSDTKITNYHDRLLILVIIILPAIIYLLFNQYNTFPYILIGVFKSQVGVMIHIIISYIVEYSPQTLLPTPIFYLGLISYHLSNNLYSCSLLVSSKSTSNTLYILSLISYFLSLCMIIFITYRWLKYIYTIRYIVTTNCDKYYNERFMISSYLSILWLTIVIYVIADAISSFGNIEYFNTTSFILSIGSFTIAGVILSVIPGTNIYIYEYIYDVIQCLSLFSRSSVTITSIKCGDNIDTKA